MTANGDAGSRSACPSNHVRDRILTRYLPLVTEALDEVIAPGSALEIVVDRAADRDAVQPSDPTTTTRCDGGRRGRDASGDRHRHGARHGVRRLALDEAGLNPRYTFETFVKGASNQFALAAALRVAETPARSYNPLFIYGSAGLGKTHLLHAIGHYVHHNYQHHEVRYVSTETFMNEYVDAIRTNTTATPSSAATARSTSCSSTTSSSWRARRASRRSSSTRSTRCTARTSRS